MRRRLATELATSDQPADTGPGGLDGGDFAGRSRLSPARRPGSRGRLAAIAGSHDTLVFIPAWNEEASLPTVLAELASELPGVDVLVVDDGSTDATSAVAGASGARVRRFPENRGLRSAVAEGYRATIEDGYAFCGRVDADGQHPALELRRLLELVRSDTCDVAIGSRFSEGAGYAADRYRPTAARRFGIGLLQSVVRLRLGRPWHDPTSGLVAASAKAFATLSEPYSSGAPEVEALLRPHAAGLRVGEVAVHMRERASGASKLRGGKAVRLVLTVAATLVLFGWWRRRGRP